MSTFTVDLEKLTGSDPHAGFADLEKMWNGLLSELGKGSDPVVTLRAAEAQTCTMTLRASDLYIYNVEGKPYADREIAYVTLYNTERFKENGRFCLSSKVFFETAFFKDRDEYLMSNKLFTAAFLVSEGARFQIVRDAVKWLFAEPGAQIAWIDFHEILTNWSKMVNASKEIITNETLFDRVGAIKGAYISLKDRIGFTM